VLFPRRQPMTRLNVLVLALLGCAEAWTKGGGAKALTGAQFDEQVTKGRGFWMVAFYAPWCGHCQMLEPEWEKAGKKLKGRAQLGSMDCQQGDAEAVCGRFDIKGFPTILVFGKERAKGEPYNGERTADAIAAFAGEAAKGFAPASMVEALGYKGVHAFLHGGSAPGRLLYLAAPGGEEGEEEGAAPAWLDALSNSYSSGGRRSVAMGFVPAADVAVAKRFKLKATALPALVFCHHAVQRWEALKAGKLKAGSKAAAKFVAAAFKRAQGAADDAALAALPRLPVFPAPKVPRKKARKSLRELTAENAKKRCFVLKGKKNVCVIMLLEPDAPGLEDDDAALLGGLADKYRNDPFALVWVAPGAEADALRAHFTLPATQANLLVLKGGKRARFAVHEGEVDRASAENFLDKVAGGGVQFTRLKAMPDLDQAAPTEKEEL